MRFEEGFEQLVDQACELLLHYVDGIEGNTARVAEKGKR